MRPVRFRAIALLAVALLGSCTDNLVAPTTRLSPTSARFDAASLPSVRFSEIHYDNTGTDAGEAIEISGPAGTDLTGWSIVLYNGSGGASYNTQPLSGTIPATCVARGVVVINYPVNGIQNGPPDGVALVNPTGGVVEFLSYEGTFAATDGPANGMTSVDIGVAEAGTETAGQSLWLDGLGVWHADAPNTFGACNDDAIVVGPIASVTVAPVNPTIAVGGTQQFTASAFDANNNPVTGATFTWSTSDPSIATVSATGLASGVAQGDATIKATASGIDGSTTLHVTAASPINGPVRISELHYDNVGADVGEGIEVEAPASVDLSTWSVVFYNGDPASKKVYLTRSLGAVSNCNNGRGVIALAVTGIQNGNPDGVALVDGNGVVVEFLSYGGTFQAADGPASGLISVDIGFTESASTPVGTSLQRDGNGVWYGAATSSFGACNTPPPPPTPTAPIVINEVMADPNKAAGGASFGEWFEVTNTGTTPVDMQGWTISSTGNGQQDHVIGQSLVVPPGGFIVLGRGADQTKNGGITIDYNYFTGPNTIFLDATDILIVRDATGATVDSVRWK